MGNVLGTRALLATCVGFVKTKLKMEAKENLKKHVSNDNALDSKKRRINVEQLTSSQLTLATIQSHQRQPLHSVPSYTPKWVSYYNCTFFIYTYIGNSACTL